RRAVRIVSLKAVGPALGPERLVRGGTKLEARASSANELQLARRPVPAQSQILSMKRDNSLRTFAGAVAIVTGGASGIGRAMGESLVRRGARVVLADVQIDLAEEVAARLRAGGGQATAEDLDVTDFTATNQLVQNTFQSAGRLDYIFNIAGIGIVG